MLSADAMPPSGDRGEAAGSGEYGVRSGVLEGGGRRFSNVKLCFALSDVAGLGIVPEAKVLRQQTSHL